MKKQDVDLSQEKKGQWKMQVGHSKKKSNLAAECCLF